jgi:hypothetical protein
MKIRKKLVNTAVIAAELNAGHIVSSLIEKRCQVLPICIFGYIRINKFDFVKFKRDVLLQGFANTM